MLDQVGFDEAHWRAQFLRQGWLRFGPDPVLQKWIAAVRQTALALALRADLQQQWLRCDGTWFVGPNVLENAPDGSLAEAGVPPLAGRAVSFAREILGWGDFGWDRGQVSICYPGFPGWNPAQESEAAHRYRINSHGAHIDGISREGPEQRRFLTETHGFVLGLPLTEADPGASPLSVWEGSHELVRERFREVFAGRPPEDWHRLDLTEMYMPLRRHCMENCKRVSVGARIGESYLVHRLAVHGVSPWRAPADAAPRAVLYFRPDPYPGEPPGWWLDKR